MVEERHSALDGIEANLVTKPRIVEDITAVDACLMARQGNPNVGLTGGKAWLQPVVEAYEHNVTGFLKWVGYLADVRRKLPKAVDRTELRHLYRNIYQRVYMEQKRARIVKGITLLQRRLGRTIEGQEAEDFAKRLQLEWGNSKFEYVERKSKGRALSYVERLALFEQFWAQLDRALDRELGK